MIRLYCKNTLQIVTKGSGPVFEMFLENTKNIREKQREFARLRVRFARGTEQLISLKYLFGEANIAWKFLLLEAGAA